jgi:hypothetical protein
VVEVRGQVKSSTCMSCGASQIRAVNGNWKGGRTRHKAGSVMRLTPGHPRAPSKGVVDAVEWALQILDRYGDRLHHSVSEEGPSRVLWKWNESQACLNASPPWE